MAILTSTFKVKIKGMTSLWLTHEQKDALFAALSEYETNGFRDGYARSKNRVVEIIECGSAKEE